MLPSENQADYTVMLPDQMEGWQAEKTILLNTPSDLYNYMDGGAELYISYGFGQAMSKTYTKEGNPEVIAEVYNLIDARNAFGVFTQAREDEEKLYGQGTYLLPGAVFFWKHRYYVSLSTWDASPEAERFIQSLAAHISSCIAQDGEIPAVVSYLPQGGLIPFGFKYFHHSVWMNAFFFISDHNILNIDKDTDAVLARYARGEGRMYLLLVQYQDDLSAGRAFNNFGKEFFPDGLKDNCVRLPDNTCLAAAKTGNLVVAVFNGETGDDARHLLTTALNIYGSCENK
ncbi:MAG: DUF6599 family protein [Bacteroidales bacterium]